MTNRTQAQYVEAFVGEASPLSPQRWAVAEYIRELRRDLAELRADVNAEYWHRVRDDNSSLRVLLKASEHRLAAHEADAALAASAFKVEMPRPGTDAAVLMKAHRTAAAERDALRAKLARVRDAAESERDKGVDYPDEGRHHAACRVLDILDDDTPTDTVVLSRERGALMWAEKFITAWEKHEKHGEWVDGVDDLAEKAINEVAAALDDDTPTDTTHQKNEPPEGGPPVRPEEPHGVKSGQHSTGATNTDAGLVDGCGHGDPGEVCDGCMWRAIHPDAGRLEGDDVMPADTVVLSRERRAGWMAACDWLALDGPLPPSMDAGLRAACPWPEAMPTTTGGSDGE